MTSLRFLVKIPERLSPQRPISIHRRHEYNDINHEVYVNSDLMVIKTLYKIRYDEFVDPTGKEGLKMISRCFRKLINPNEGQQVRTRLKWLVMLSY